MDIISPTFFYHNLVADTPARGVEANTMLASKLLDVFVLRQVGLGLILQIVVEGHDDLTIVVDLGSADRHELQGSRPGVVVRHAMVGRYRDVVAGLDLLPGAEPDREALDDLLRQGLRGRRGGGGLLG